MKHYIFLLAALLALPAFANRPDSVWVRPDIKDGARGLQVAWSQDQKHWHHIATNVFESDYGPWGAQKKMWYPALKFDGKKFTATFIPDLKQCEVGRTESADFILWKPQDYDLISSEADFQRIVSQSKADSQKPLRVPYIYIKALQEKKALREANGRKEMENYVATGCHFAEDCAAINAKLTIDWADKKSISPDLMGIFFEDISYAADGGLYAELIQNRDFEYTAADRKDWNALTAWRLEGEGLAVDVSTQAPMHRNNAHYAQLKTEKVGGSIVNEGFDGIPLKGGDKYELSLFLKGAGAIKVSLREAGKVLASTTFKATKEWRRQSVTLKAAADAKSAELVIEPQQRGELDLDFVSLFPKDTYKGRSNGLRKDLAETIADLKPRFVRFPGGCASHGNGINNIYHWQATIGDLWERQGDYNIWHYHQTRGLGFYEYFQFCEDIGAEPVPVLAAGVPCQNSGRGGYEGGPQNGQQGGIPFLKDLGGKPSPYQYMGKDLTMESYLQELLDLIEWANGDAKKSPLAAMRAKAGHPKPFNLKYLGIGNEDMLGDTFMERYRFLIEGVKAKHPEITVIGTVGPFWEGSDYEYGWQEAKAKKLEIVDEHYYNLPGWYFSHRDFYDGYDRKGPKVYLGEWASKGNNVSNALVEAAYMTHLEENADVVVMSSYAPLLAKDKHYSWTPDLIYFNNNEVRPTANYYVQRVFGHNAGDTYVGSKVDVTVEKSSSDAADKKKSPSQEDLERGVRDRIDRSVVVDSKTGDVIIKLVSMLPKEATMTIDLGEEVAAKLSNATSKKTKKSVVASIQTMCGGNTPDRTKEWEGDKTEKVTLTSPQLQLSVAPYSVTVVRVK